MTGRERDGDGRSPGRTASPLPDRAMLGLSEAERSVVRAVGDAAAVVRQMQPGIVTNGTSVRWKPDGTVVTAADVTSEAIIADAIARASRGAYRLIAEERAVEVTLSAEGSEATGTTWFVDPLDGTSAYRRGSSDYAILVSKWRAGRPRFSIAHYPAVGGWLIVSGGAVRSAGIPVADPAAIGRSCLCYLDEAAVARFTERIPGVTFGLDEESTSALFGLALGEAEAVAVQVRALKSWDVAPLIHAIEASGGRICDDQGARLVLSGSALPARFILAARSGRDMSRLLSCTRNGSMI